MGFWGLVELCAGPVECLYANVSMNGLREWSQPLGSGSFHSLGLGSHYACSRMRVPNEECDLGSAEGEAPLLEGAGTAPLAHPEGR